MPRKRSRILKGGVNRLISFRDDLAKPFGISLASRPTKIIPVRKVVFLGPGSVLTTIAPGVHMVKTAAPVKAYGWPKKRRKAA